MCSVTVLAVANQKGGVGKTTSVVSLGAYLGSFGARVLLVDCDAQANTTGFLGVQAETGGLYDVLTGELSVRDAVVSTTTKGVDLLPSTPDLAGADIELLGAEQPNAVLKAALEDVRQR